MHALEAMLVAKVQTDKAEPMITKGLPASPGAVVGEIVFYFRCGRGCSKTGQAGHSGSPGNRSEGRSRHARRDRHPDIKRWDDKPCSRCRKGNGKTLYHGSDVFEIDVQSESAKAVGQVLNAGDIITIDGGSGAVSGRSADHPARTGRRTGHFASVAAGIRRAITTKTL